MTYKVNEAILSAVVVKCGSRLLDVACVTGWRSAAAIKRQAIVTGLDGSREYGGQLFMLKC
ncbi:hypothetical protein [Nostoc sp.]|uniref:hypothetical protein n=1 Tax=Nostoc sp. TaxID=1180 RepID=UPI002FFBEA00